MRTILEVELFDLWGMNFMGPFPSSFNNLDILLVVDYVSKWVEEILTHTNNVSGVAKFLHSHIFTRFGTPRALIPDGGTHFCNKLVDKVLQKYGVRHCTSLAYHPQANGQAEVSNREISQFWRKQSIIQGKTGRRRLMMHFGHTGHHLKPHWVCRHSD